MQYACQAFFQAVDDDTAAAVWAGARHGTHQMVELALDGGQIVKDVGVIELQVVQNGCARVVMDKLAAFVKKRSVVFISLNHKGLALPQAGGNAEVQGHAADQKAWAQPGLLQNPAGHGGGGGFAVRARDGHHVAALQDMLGQPLRPTGVGQASVQDSFHQWEFGRAVGQVRAADHVAHHVQIGLQCQLVCAKSFNQVNAQRAQLVAHGRIDAGVAAGDLVAGLARQCGQTAHESAANTKNVNMHAAILEGGPVRQVADDPTPGGNGKPRHNARPMTDLKAEIAAQAARWVVEEGLEYGPAKRRAVKALGLPTRQALQDNATVDDAVIDYIALFCADTQPSQLRALRALALVWMQRLAQFRPHLGGAVWHGTATRLSDIYLQLFCDDCKSAEIALIDNNVNYVASSVTGRHGQSVDTLSLHAFCPGLNEDVGVHLMIYDHDDVRGALQPDSKGRKPRGDAQALRQLLLEDV